MNNRIRALLYSSNIWYLGEGMFGPLIAIFTERIGGDVLEISWAWATYLITSGVLILIFARYINERRNSEKMMLLGYGLNAFFTFGYLFVSSPMDLLIVQAGLGVASALAIPTWSTLYARFEDKKDDVWEWGLADGQASIVTGIAILLGGLIVGYGSFTVLFVLMGAIQTLAFLYLWKNYPWKIATK